MNINKKYIGLVIFSLILSTQCMAYDVCTEVYGVEVSTSNRNAAASEQCSSHPEQCNTKTFCRSYAAMNWWTAQTWCKSIGGTLAKFESLCPNTPKNVDSNNKLCFNMKGAQTISNWSVWVSDPYGNTQALGIRNDDGSIIRFSRTSNQYIFALCE